MTCPHGALVRWPVASYTRKVYRWDGKVSINCQCMLCKYSGDGDTENSSSDWMSESLKDKISIVLSTLDTLHIKNDKIVPSFCEDNPFIFSDTFQFILLLVPELRFSPLTNQTSFLWSARISNALLIWTCCKRNKPLFLLSSKVEKDISVQNTNSFIHTEDVQQRDFLHCIERISLYPGSNLPFTT